MGIDPAEIWRDLEAISQQSPLIHNITNHVVMQQTADSLLAIGASPVMTVTSQDTAEMAKAASAVVINMGTPCPGWVKSAQDAAGIAATKSIPVVFDPVGVGATAYRRQTATEILNTGAVTAVRGNGSEMLALCGDATRSRGVDSQVSFDRSIKEAQGLSLRLRSVVIATGPVDWISNGQEEISIHNGHPFMTRTTGMGCIATAIVAAFMAVNRSAFQASAHAMAVMGIAGEEAAERSAGPGSFKTVFIDTLASLSLSVIERRLRSVITP